MNLDQKNIIAMLGIENLPDERKLAILDKMTSLLEKRLMARSLKALSEPDQEKFAAVLEANNPDATQEFIQAHFPEFENWIAEETDTLKQELADHVSGK